MAKLSLDGGMVGEGNPAGPSLWQYQERPMIGRTETKIQIKEALLNYAVAGNEGSYSKLFVRGIVGAGGMGKTTLAHSIFNDVDVEAAFSNKKWVSVGDKFDIKRVMNEIIGDDSHLVREDDLHSEMRNKFRDQSLLIVLDDAWCDESVKWRLLQSSLSRGSKAHALIVTTRNKAVARAIPHDSEYLDHELLGLPYTECMEIFKRWAFMGEQAERHLDDLEGLSKQVVQKLNGNPLSATMMGTFLHEHLCNRPMWVNIVNDVIGWPHTPEGNVVDRVVGLSYLHLPPDLKSWFAYCALFPKGFKFDKKTMVQMWIGQGYVHPPSGVLMEHSGSDHFDYLYQRSFFQLNSSYGDRPDYYIMHDLIHDFAQKVFTEGWQMDASDTEDDGTLYEEIRHLSFHCNGTEPLKRLPNFKKLRTLILELDVTAAPPAPLDVLAKFKYLCLLVLKDYKLPELPYSIRHLQFLRYLDIKMTKIRALPELVCDLVELQFLKLPDHCALPKGMNKLINLRFIEAGAEGVPQFKGIGQLTSLQGRVKFKVENKSGWKISELKGLNHLHGQLVVCGLRDVICREEVEQACLTQKKYLEELVLDWRVESQVQQHVRNDDVETQVLEGLFPPPNLKVLRIRNNRGARFPSWMEGHDRCPISSSLVRLELGGCCNWECLPTLGRWPYLKELTILGAHGVKKIGPEFYGGRVYFPRLEILHLGQMSLWEEWEMPAAGEIHSGGGGGGGRHVFPSRLKHLIIIECPKLASLAPILCHSTNLERVEIRGCAELALSWEEGDGCGWMFPSLKNLIIEKCPKLASLDPILRHSTNLERLVISTCAELASLGGCGSTLPSRLEYLIIEECPKLASLAPILRHSADLWSIDIRRCAELALSLEEGDGCVWRLHSLKRLYIEDCPKLASLAPMLRHSTNLVTVDIRRCAELALSWEEGDECGWMFPSLKLLHIEECPKLASLDPILRHSTNLERVEIKRCADQLALSWEEGDDERGWMLPSGLKLLSIVECCSKLLPSLSHLTALQELAIRGFPNLRCIPPSIHSLPSLEVLRIGDCPAIESLPDGGLPPSLLSLYIWGCPLLKGRCREGGPDRPKIPTRTRVLVW